MPYGSNILSRTELQILKILLFLPLEADAFTLSDHVTALWYIYLTPLATIQHSIQHNLGHI